MYLLIQTFRYLKIIEFKILGHKCITNYVIAIFIVLKIITMVINDFLITFIII